MAEKRSNISITMIQRQLTGVRSVGQKGNGLAFRNRVTVEAKKQDMNITNIEDYGNTSLSTVRQAF